MSHSQISLREYGKLHIGEFEPSKPSVTQLQAAQLAKLKPLYGFDIFKWANQHTLVAQQYVGTVQIGGLTVEILPKIEGSNATNEMAIRRNLIAMLMVALDLDISEGDVAKIAVQKFGILEILIRLFCDKLFLQLHRGLVRRYEGQEGNLSVLRGRLAINEQLRVNAANPERLYCRFDEFQEDNPLNQILKAAIRLLLRVSRNQYNQRQLAELLLAFEGASDVAGSSLPWHRISFDRLNDRYKPSFKLAALFLKRMSPDVTSGHAGGFSLFFDMNALFEEYIGRMAKRVCRSMGIEVRLQGPQRFLAIDESSNANAFAMKPDIVGFRGGQTAWIVDTKWKQLSVEEAREGAAQADLYQMYAYANNYVCQDVILLYPHHAGLGADAGVRGSYRLNAWFTRQAGPAISRIKIATIDLSDLQSVPTQLYALFASQEKDVEAVAA
jgi:5-methylcytosine-specific restriction enzyme subunit McrC